MHLFTSSPSSSVVNVTNRTQTWSAWCNALFCTTLVTCNSINSFREFLLFCYNVSGDTVLGVNMSMHNCLCTAICHVSTITTCRWKWRCQCCSSSGSSGSSDSGPNYHCCGFVTYIMHTVSHITHHTCMITRWLMWVSLHMIGWLMLRVICSQKFYV